MTTPLSEADRLDLLHQALHHARTTRATLRALERGSPIGPDRVRAAQLRELAEDVVEEVLVERRAYGWRPIPIDEVLEGAPQ